MTTPNILTDLNSLSRNRARADGESLFLQNAAADDIEDRLSVVNRAFKNPAIVTAFPQIWENRLADATVVQETEVLALEPKAHDLVIHCMGLHWANDPVGQIIQCRNALEKDGMLIVAALGGQTLHELRSCIGQAEADISGGMSPRVAPMGEIRDLGALLQRAGLALPVADSHTLTVEYTDMWHLMRDLRAMGEANAMAARRRAFSRADVFKHAAKLYQNHFKTAQGRVKATFELVFLTGWMPDESQQKALRPGSAKQRLADALSTRETPLQD